MSQIKIQNQKITSYNGKTAVEGFVNAKVVSMSDTLLTNVNGTEYSVGTIEVEGKQFSAMCYAKNLSKVTVGENRLCNVIFTEDQPKTPIILITPLTNGVRATAEDFGFDFEATLAAAGVGAEEVTV